MNSSRRSGGNSILSKQSLLILGLGTLFGYVLLPILLIEFDVEDTVLISKSQVREPAVGQRTLDADNGSVRGAADAVQQRLVEDHDVLSSQSLPTATTPYVMKTNRLPDHHRKKILVTGGAGFVGSHLVDKLMQEGHEVTVVDNFFTGQKKNIAHWLHHPNFRYDSYYLFAISVLIIFAALLFTT